MSRFDRTIKSFSGAIKNSNQRKTSPFDATAEVLRVEGNTAWVHIPGGVDETPVRLTVNAKAGDTVQVRVGGGRAWITGNATAPPTDDTKAEQAVKSVGVIKKVVNTVKDLAEKTAKIAGNTNQYFWHTESGSDTGAHITEIPREDFLEDPTNGGGNLLARSNGVAVRDGLTELATFSANGMTVNKNGSQVAEFGEDIDLLNVSIYGDGGAMYVRSPEDGDNRITHTLDHEYIEDQNDSISIISPRIDLQDITYDPDSASTGDCKNIYISPQEGIEIDGGIAKISSDGHIFCQNIGQTFSDSATVNSPGTNPDSYVEGATITLPWAHNYSASAKAVYLIHGFATFPSNATAASRRAQIYNNTAGTSLRTQSHWGQGYITVSVLDTFALGSADQTYSIRVSAGVAINGINTFIKAIRIA